MRINFIRTLIILGLYFLINENIQARHVISKKPVYLTIQADNGNLLKKTINDDGTITCIFKPSDVIRINTITLNGLDVTYQLEGYKYTTPILTENSTLEISFDNTTTDYFPTKYNTITSSLAEQNPDKI